MKNPKVRHILYLYPHEKGAKAGAKALCGYVYKKYTRTVKNPELTCGRCARIVTEKFNRHEF